MSSQSTGTQSVGNPSLCQDTLVRRKQKQDKKTRFRLPFPSHDVEHVAELRQIFTFGV